MLFAALFGLVGLARSATLPVIELTPNRPNDLINNEIAVFYTLDTLLGVDAWRQIAMGSMTRLDNNYIAPAELKNNTFWIVLDFNHVNDQPLVYYLNFAFNRTDQLTLYEVLPDDSVVLLSMQGDTFPFQQRLVDYRSFIFPVAFQGGERRKLLLNADKRGSVDRFPLKIFPAARFERIRNSEYLMYGITFGLFLMIVAWAFIIFLLSRNWLFLHYGLYALVIGIYLSTSLGFTFQFLTPGWPQLNYYNLAVLGSVSMVFFSFFSLHFFKPYGKMKWLARIQWGVTYGIVAIMLLPLLTPLTGGSLIRHYMTILLSAYGCIVVIFLCVFLRIAFKWSANRFIISFFLVAVLCSFLGIIYSVLVDNGVFHDYIFSDNANSVLAGFMAEFSILTIALAHRYKSDKAETHTTLEMAHRKSRWSFIEGQEQEKRKIASDLHDNIGASLYFLNTEIESLSKEDFEARKVAILSELRSLSKDIRQISYELLPVSLEEMGFVAAAESLCQRNQNGVRISLKQTGKGYPIPQQAGVQLFRMLQELLKNAIRHGRPHQVLVKLDFGVQLFCLEVEDDGLGMDVTSIRKGIGLRSIEERAALLGAQVRWQSVPGAGCVCRIEVPLTESGQFHHFGD